MGYKLLDNGKICIMNAVKLIEGTEKNMETILVKDEFKEEKKKST